MKLLLFLALAASLHAANPHLVVYLYDYGTRVPFIASWPGVIEKGAKSDAMIQWTDIHRKAGAGAYWHEWAREMKKDERAKAIVMRYYQRPEWELYKVSEDKWELDNLLARRPVRHSPAGDGGSLGEGGAGNPAHAETLTTLQKELAAWMKTQGDQQTVFNDPRRLADKKSWHPDHAHEVKPPRKRKK